jgi:hypothetical protein
MIIDSIIGSNIQIVLGNILDGWYQVKDEKEKKQLMFLALQIELKYNLDLLDCYNLKNPKAKDFNYSALINLLSSEALGSFFKYEKETKGAWAEFAKKLIELVYKENDKFDENEAAIVHVYKTIAVLKALAIISSQEGPNPQIQFKTRLKNLQKRILFLYSQLNLGI